MILGLVIHAREKPITKSEDPIPELKRQLAQLVVARLDGRSQVYAADLLGTDQPRVSDLRRGRLERFSLEQLLRFIARIDGTARITVEWSTRRAWLFAPVRK
ncbi:MAG TPA: XRE family transcriptional regulator [Gemmatimonadaceae bacterium]